MMREPDLRRSMLFVAGADPAVHAEALAARPDVLIQDLEDFTPPEAKAAARALSADLFARARAQGVLPAVRVNRLDGIGREDLAAVVPARSALILLPMAESGAQIAALDAEIARLETAHGLGAGAIEILPTIETALGVLELRSIAKASGRVRSCLLGAEDMAADLQAVRSPEGDELAYARQRFLLECRALGVEPVDAPYTFSDIEGCAREAARSRRLGYRSKSTVTAAHVEAIHGAFTPSGEERASAQRIVAGFEALYK